MSRAVGVSGVESDTSPESPRVIIPVWSRGGGGGGGGGGSSTRRCNRYTISSRRCTARQPAYIWAGWRPARRWSTHISPPSPASVALSPSPACRLRPGTGPVPRLLPAQPGTGLGGLIYPITPPGGGTGWLPAGLGMRSWVTATEVIATAAAAAAARS